LAFSLGPKLIEGEMLIRFVYKLLWRWSLIPVKYPAVLVF
jgi:hypothetical protein